MVLPDNRAILIKIVDFKRADWYCGSIKSFLGHGSRGEYYGENKNTVTVFDGSSDGLRQRSR